MRRTPPYPLYRGRSPVQGESGVDKLPGQQSRPVCPGGVRIVRQYPRGSTPRPTTARDGYPDSVECRHHLRIITCLARGDQKRPRPTADIDAHMDLRRPPTTGSSEPMISRLSWVPGRTIISCASGMNVAPGGGGIDTDLPESCPCSWAWVSSRVWTSCHTPLARSRTKR